jgi:phosphate ABC transporter phosphate-binding protein
MTAIIEKSRLGFRLLLLNSLLASLIAGCALVAASESVDSLSKVKTLYIAPLKGTAEADRLREGLARHLAGSRFKLVQSPKSAEAILTGTVEIWVKGYVSVDPRAPSANRQAAYAGYFSVEVSSPDGEPLWSSLVTPHKPIWSDITDNLASNAARKLMVAAEAPRPSGSAPPAPGALAKTSLSAAGATFPAPLYQKWFEDFEQQHPGVHLRYSPIGSQAGVERLVAREIDFAGSDVLPAAAVGASAASHFQLIGTVLGAVVPIYNLNGVARVLHFSPEILADIYLGRAQKWNDEAIRRLNKGASLPDAAIKVIHRSDGSGTTWIWSDFLSKTSPSWSSSVGRGTTLHWPAGVGAEGNDGVAEAVRSTPNSIGYVELTYAIRRKLSFGAVRNRAGQFIQADLESVAEAARAVPVSDDSAHTLTASSAKLAYPIAAFTWLVLPTEVTDPSKRAALAELLKWILTSGQKDCSSLGYAPLPREVVESQLRIVDKLH